MIEDRPKLPVRVTLLAVAGGFVAANAHFSQPLLPVIARDLGLATTAMGMLPAVTQIGMAAGLLGLVPLYDLVERRRLLVLILLGLALAAGLEALAPSPALLLVAAFGLGLGCSAAQVMTPFAALLAPTGSEGAASGRVLSGILLGVLLSRIVAGTVQALAGWRWLYAGSSIAILLVALIVARTVPASRNPERPGYAALWASIGGLVRSLPALRRHAANGALTFGALMTFWGTYAQYLETRGIGVLVTGLIGLVGVAGAGCAALAGGLIDRGQFAPVQQVAAALIAAGFLLLSLAGGSLALFCLGVLLLDAGGGLSHAGNQAAAFRLAPALRGRINSVYMVAYFLGGAAGVTVAGVALSSGGWTAVCALGIAAGMTMGVVEWRDPVARKVPAHV